MHSDVDVHGRTMSLGNHNHCSEDAGTVCDCLPISEQAIRVTRVQRSEVALSYDSLWLMTARSMEFAQQCRSVDACPYAVGPGVF